MSHIDEETLNLYLDDLLDPAARVVAEAHLAACAACRADLAALSDMFARMDALPIEPIPIDLTAAVLARIEPARQPSRARLAQALLAAQAALIVPLALWLAPLLSGWVAWQPAPPTSAPLDQLIGLVDMRVAETQPTLAVWNAINDVSGPFPNLAPGHWLLIFAITAAIWLAGNRLLLGSLAQPRDAHQEAA